MDPVCDMDGKTHDAPCIAKCMKALIAYRGECKATGELIRRYWGLAGASETTDGDGEKSHVRLCWQDGP